MSTIKKFYTLLTALFISAVVMAQPRLMEFTLNHLTTPITGNGFGPRTTNHVVYFDKDRQNNGNFNAQGNNPDPITAPFISATVSLVNQQFTGLTYGAGTTNGAGTSNAVPTGLVFGAGPAQATGAAPGVPNVQQASPLNSYDLLGAFGNNWGPRNGMFMSDPTATPNVSPFPTQPGTGIDAEGLLPSPANDANGGVCVFTCAQVMFDQNRVHNATTRHYYGDLQITFSRFVSQPVIHFAGLGGSYRYAPVGTDPNNLSTWLSTFFTTELELIGPYTMTLMASNQFMSLSGNFITNNNLVNPNGESTDQGTPPAGQFNNFGAATGSVRINGPATRVLRFRVYLRGASGSQFNWSAPGSAVNGGSRDPLTGDIWFVSATLKQEQLIPLPATGLKLNAALNGSDVMLTWKTLSEIDTREFEIQRSTDGVNFTTIATKAAAGNSPVEVNYAHTDANMQALVYYYRLKLVDMDNDYSYSNVAVVRRAGSFKAVKIFPNPVASQLNIEFSNAKGDYMISLYNQAGQEVAAQRSTINYAVQYVTVERKQLPAGTYILKMINTESGEVFKEKVVLQ
jgi:hypothetical protein